MQLELTDEPAGAVAVNEEYLSTCSISAHWTYVYFVCFLFL